MIYEDNKKEERPPHINYREYKKQLEEKPASNENLIIFVSAFFVMLLIFLGAVKQLSPDVDVSIGTPETPQMEEVAERGSVDSRLKTLQMEDNSYGSDDSTFSPELEEKVRLPERKVRVLGEDGSTSGIESIVLDVKNGEKTKKQANKETETKQQVTPVPTNPLNTVPVAAPVTSMSAKVIVGYYTTAEQAEVAKGIILDSGLNIQPFVKNIGGAYTLQVGSFSSREKAQSVANDLLRNNFPARVIYE